MPRQIFRLFQRRQALSTLTWMVLVTFTWSLVSSTMLAAQTLVPPPPVPRADAAFPV